MTKGLFAPLYSFPLLGHRRPDMFLGILAFLCIENHRLYEQALSYSFTQPVVVIVSLYQKIAGISRAMIMPTMKETVLETHAYPT